MDNFFGGTSSTSGQTRRSATVLVGAVVIIVLGVLIAVYGHPGGTPAWPEPRTAEEKMQLLASYATSSPQTSPAIVAEHMRILQEATTTADPSSNPSTQEAKMNLLQTLQH